VCVTDSSVRRDEVPNPRIVEHPDDQYVIRNEPATLNCKAEGDPAPTVTWYRYGRPVVTANDNPTSHRMLLPSGQLFFLRVQHHGSTRNHTDLGVYYCNATNPRTGDSAVSDEASMELAGRISLACRFLAQDVIYTSRAYATMSLFVCL